MSQHRQGHVVVYGATASGVIAACAAADSGMRVTLVAGESPVGGMVAHGLSHTDIESPKTLGGLTQKFFREVGRQYGANHEIFNFEPHVAQLVFSRMLASFSVTQVAGIAAQCTRDGDGITSLKLLQGQEIPGDFFIDASYEGSLLALAKVRSVYGRESSSQYGETLAGQRPAVAKYYVPSVDAHGDLQPGCMNVFPDQGAADDRVMAFTYRLCVTDDPSNRMRFQKPERYQPENYQLLLSSLNRYRYKVPNVTLPNRKFDLNGGQHVMDTDFSGGN
jgi:hypothetical protein